MEDLTSNLPEWICNALVRWAVPKVAEAVPKVAKAVFHVFDSLANSAKLTIQSNVRSHRSPSQSHLRNYATLTRSTFVLGIVAMFECVVCVELPIYPGEEREITSYRIASYDFDPGLQVGEKVQVNDASFFQTRRNGKRVRSPQIERFSFQAIVKERLKTIKPDFQLDSGEVVDQLIMSIVIEVADKEQLPEISRIMREFEDRNQT